MTDRIAYNIDTKRRLEYTRRILKAIKHDSPDDREDLPSILRAFQEEIIKAFTDGIVEQLERIAYETADWMYGGTMKAVNITDAIVIVKGVQNE